MLDAPTSIELKRAAPPGRPAASSTPSSVVKAPVFRDVLLRCSLVFIALGIGLAFIPAHPRPLVALAFDQDLAWLIIVGAVLGMAAFAPNVRLANVLMGTATRRLGATTLAISVAVFVIGLVGTSAVFHGFSLSRDEAMARFDEAILAHGRLIWPIPAPWRPYADALEPLFRLPVRDNVGWVSSYLPVNAAIRAAFGTIASPILAGPTLAALSIVALLGIGRRLWPTRPDATLVAILMLASSSQLLMTAMTAYAMTAHLTFNLLWLWLFLRDDRPSHVAAILVGALATGLHQLAFHPLFVMPFVMSLWITRRFRLAAFYTAFYVVIVLFWIAYWQIMLRANGMQGASATDAGAFATKVWDLIRVFDMGNIQIMVGNLVRFTTWQNPILVPLILIAFVHRKTMPRPVALAAAGILATGVTVFAVLPFQGHGWGYRYFHGLLGSFALIAAHGWVAITTDALDQTRRQVASRVLAISAFTMAIMLPARACQTEAFVAPFAKADDRIRHADSDVVFIDSDVIPYATDLVRNDPLLKTRPMVFDLWSLKEPQVRALCGAHDVSVFDQVDGVALDFPFRSQRFLGPSAPLRAIMAEIHCGRAIRRRETPRGDPR